MKTFQGTPRYKLLDHLGSGTFGEVYEVFDRERKTHVVLKRPHEMSAESLYSFKREFRALADLSHPNLVDLYHELCARWCRGKLKGQKGEPLREDAERWMRARGIVNPEPFANNHIPCTDLDSVAG